MVYKTQKEIYPNLGQLRTFKLDYIRREILHFTLQLLRARDHDRAALHMAQAQCISKDTSSLEKRIKNMVLLVVEHQLHDI